MGKLALPATLLWTVSVASRLGKRPSAGSHSFMELSASCRSCRRGTGGRRSALGEEEGKAGQVVGCGHGEARQGPRPGQGEGHCVGGVPHLRLSGAGFTCMVRVCALAIYARGAFPPCHGRVRPAHSVHRAWRGKECAPSPSSLLPGKPCKGIVCQIANVTCRGEGQEAASAANFRHAGVRAREVPWAALKQERARPRRRSKRRLRVGQNTVCLISPVQRHIPVKHFGGSALPRVTQRRALFLQQKLVASRPILFQGRRQVRPPGVGMGPRHCSGDRPPCSGPRRPRNRLAPVAHAAAQNPPTQRKLRPGPQPSTLRVVSLLLLECVEPHYNPRGCQTLASGETLLRRNLADGTPCETRHHCRAHATTTSAACASTGTSKAKEPCAAGDSTEVVGAANCRSSSCCLATA